jgi:FixJ family two-component response regulator
MTVRVIQAGAVDFLTKPVDGRSFLTAVRRALARDAEQRLAEREADSIHARYDRLTPRERQVLSHVVAGRLNKQIAFDLNAALRTVKAHRAQIMKKMQVRSVADLVRLAEHLDVSAPMEPVAAPRPVRYARTANH